MHIPIAAKCRALKLVCRRRLAFASGAMGAWFGFRRGSFRKSLRKVGIGPVPLGHPDWHCKHLPDGELDEQALEPMLLYPMCIELEATPDELAALDRARVEECRNSHLEQLRQHSAVLGRAMNVSQPGAVAIIQGYEPFSAVARELAIRRDLSVIAFENTALKDRMLWDDHSALTTNRNLSRNFYWRHRERACPKAADAYCETLIAETKRRKQEEHASPERGYESRESGRPNVLFLGQVYTDSSVIFGIGDWSTPVSLIRAVAQLASELDFNLWIKLHPKENGGHSPVVNQPYAQLTHRKLMADQTFRQLAEDQRVMIDDENTYDTYDLMAKADAVVTLNSQAGLEAAIRGIPAVLAGQAFYGGLGFTLDAPSPATLKVQLDEALGMNADRRLCQRMAARVFTHLFFESYCVPKEPDAVARLIARRCFGLSGR